MTMVIDFVGCWVIEVACKYFFADLEPKPMITRGRERREKRRAEQVKRAEEEKATDEHKELERLVAEKQPVDTTTLATANGKKLKVQ